MVKKSSFASPCSRNVSLEEFFRPPKGTCGAEPRDLVDLRDAGLAALDEAFGLSVGLGENACREPVVDVVCHRERLLEVVDPNDREHRPEDLFLGEAHVRVDVREHRGLDEKAVLVDAAGQPRAARLEGGAFLVSDPDVLEGVRQFAFGRLLV